MSNIIEKIKARYILHLIHKHANELGIDVDGDVIYYTNRRGTYSYAINLFAGTCERGKEDYGKHDPIHRYLRKKKQKISRWGCLL